MKNLQDWMERLFTAITLTLLYANRLRGAIVFDAVKVQMEAGNLLQTVRSFHELGISQQPDVASDLKYV